MSKKVNDFAYYLTKFLTSFLVNQKGASSNTIKSYRDTFKLLLVYFSQEKKIKISKICLDNINKQSIIEFLEYLENEKGNSVNTRNQRLAAIHSFCKYVQIELPNYIHPLQEILEISSKTKSKKVIEHLTPEAMTLS